MFNKSLIVGKFYPPHLGHIYLIDQALSQTVEGGLTVVVCDQEGEVPAASLRATWIKEEFPGLNVVVKDTNGYPEDDSWFWASITYEWLGYIPDAVFTSEDYGDTWAKALGCDHVKVDLWRKTYPISGTKVRANPQKWLKYLPKPVRAYYVPRVVVIGAESTGTTTLTKMLAEAFDTEWVPEFGRAWGERYHEPNDEWDPQEFITIARMQNYLEDEAAKKAKNVLFCDTDAFATSLWYEYYFEEDDWWLPYVEKEDVNNHTFYIVTSPEGVPFIQDAYGMRELRQTREWFHQRTIEKLTEFGKHFIVVKGDKHERFMQAGHAVNEMIEELLQNDIHTLEGITE